MISLVIFALVDSLSVGTLVIPLTLILQPQIRWKMVTVYCIVLGLFYFALGILLILGLDIALESTAAIMDSRIGLWTQLVIGGLLTIWALPYLLPEVRKFGTCKNVVKTTNQGSLARWETRLVDRFGIASIAVTALLAGVVESATMAPYIAATGILGTSSLSLPMQMFILTGYCIVMFTPAVLLMVVRRVSGDRFNPQLSRLKGWLSRQVTDNTPLLIGAIGIVMVLYSCNGLFR